MKLVIGDALFFGLPISIFILGAAIVIGLILKKKVKKLLVLFLLLIVGWLWFANYVAEYLHLGGR